MIKSKIYRFLHTSLWLISIFAVYVILLLNFVYNASVKGNATEKVTIDGFLLGGHVILVLAFGFLLLLAVFQKQFNKINPYILFAVLSVAYVGMAIYLIANVDPTLRADASSVFRIARRISVGDYSAFTKGGYIERYPQQTGLLFYDSVLQIFSKSPQLNFSLNVCFVLGINFFTLKISELMSNKDRTAAILTVLFSFAFLPQFFFVLFAYGLIPGFFFTVLGFYNAIRFTRDYKIYHAAFAVLALSVASCLKQNFLIGVIAVLIYWILDAVRLHGKDLLKPLLAAMALLLCFSLPSQMILFYYEEKTDVRMDGGTPTVLWIAMGTDMGSSSRGPGWYNGFNYSTYTDSGYDPEIAARIGEERLKENIERMKKDPQKAIVFFRDKTVSQWCEPMYQSTWSGPLEDCNQFTHTPLLQSIYRGETALKNISYLSKAVTMMILGFTLVFLMIGRKSFYSWEPLLLFFIGGLLFQSVWEAKSQYVYPYLFCMIPTAAIGMKLLCEKTKRKIESVLEKRRLQKAS